MDRVANEIKGEKRKMKSETVMMKAKIFCESVRNGFWVNSLERTLRVRVTRDVTRV